MPEAKREWQGYVVEPLLMPMRVIFKFSILSLQVLKHLLLYAYLTLGIIVTVTYSFGSLNVCACL